MLKYIETGAVNDKATTLLDNEVYEARLKEEWRVEYMLFATHDNDVFEEGYDKGFQSRQSEIDNLSAEIADKDVIIADKDAEIEALKKQLGIL